MTLPDRRRQHLVDEAADLLARIAVHLARVEGGQTVMDRMRQDLAGPPAQRYDSPRVDGHRSVLDDRGDPMPATADPTGEAAVAAADGIAWAKDRAEYLLVRLDRLIVRVHDEATRIVTILEAYPPAHAPSVADKAAVARDNATAEPSCQLCASVRDSHGRPMWSDVYSKLSKPTTVDGRLAEPMWLCRWCYDRVATTGRAPNHDEIALYHSTGKVPWPRDIPKPA